MKIKKMERYEATTGQTAKILYGKTHPAGMLVLYSDARAREDALLEALKECERAWVEGTPIEGTWAETIRQIEATR